MSLYAGPAVLGIVRGRGQGSLTVEAVTPGFVDSPPRRGEFLLLERAEGEAVAVRVVEARAGGPFAEGREAGASYLAELLQADVTAVPDSVRELLHRLHLELHVLGVVRGDGAGLAFQASTRELDPFGHRLRRPSPQVLAFLASAGQIEGRGVVEFGKLSLGHEVQVDVPVLFSIDRLKSRRSFVFARAGYGKSNLVKWLLSRLYDAPPDVGLLILDPEGEYAFAQTAEGRRVPGLADHPGLRSRLRVFTQRRSKELHARYHDVIVPGLKIDFGDCEPGEILQAFVHPEKQEQVWTNWLRSLGRRGRGGEVRVDDRWRQLIAALDDKQYAITDDELAKILFGRNARLPAQGGDKREGNVSFQAIRNNLVPLLRRLHDPDSTLLRDACGWLDQGNLVVLDLSLGSHSDARALADLLLFRIFQSRVQALTDGQPRSGVLAVFEEAQTLLSPQEKETSIFVRWVKEGRKYGLGALMVTQQPGAVANQLVSQGDNFFVMHLLGEDDLRLLQRINAHYTEDLLEAIRSEPVKGNCYFWSAPDQPYVVPCRVANFDELAKALPARKLAAGAASLRLRPTLEPLVDLVLSVLARDPRVFLMPVASIDGVPAGDVVAVACDYLRHGVEAVAVAGAGDTQTSIPKDLAPLLQQVGVLARPDVCTARWQRGDFACWLLDRKALAAVCHDSGHALKPARDWRLEVNGPRGPQRQR